MYNPENLLQYSFTSPMLSSDEKLAWELSNFVLPFEVMAALHEQALIEFALRYFLNKLDPQYFP
jgi:hypothetical protein